MNEDLKNAPIAIWTGSDRVADDVLSSVTIIIRSGGCSWNRCLMCQYRHERYYGLNVSELTSAMNEQLETLDANIAEHNPSLVKIYTSGSFFDNQEVPPAVRDKVAELCKGRLLTVECRGDFVDYETISSFQNSLKDETGAGGLIVAIGLETSSDHIREKCIDKGLTFEQYVSASAIIRKAGGMVKTYLLHKPAYVSEREAYEDMISSVRDILPHSDLISLNPCSVQRNTIVERLWKQGSYRPPYLWSVAKVLAESSVHITCDALGGGQKRGAHNCGVCDQMILDAIKEYNLNADQELIRSVVEMNCGCKKEWEFV
ncbi:MAG: archaeosine biosynthesis radical SAM protein RaSEA, partial [Methanobacteriota archaeon]